MQLNIVSLALLVLGVGMPVILPARPWVGWLLCFFGLLLLAYGHREWLRNRTVTGYAVCLAVLSLVGAGGLAISIFGVRTLLPSQPAEGLPLKETSRPEQIHSLTDEDKRKIRPFLAALAAGCPQTIEISSVAEPMSMEAANDLAHEFEDAGWTVKRTKAAPDIRGISIVCDGSEEGHKKAGVLETIFFGTSMYHGGMCGEGYPLIGIVIGGDPIRVRNGWGQHIHPGSEALPTRELPRNLPEQLRR